MTTDDGAAPATHTGRPAGVSKGAESVDCEFCGNAYRRDRMVEHVQTEHAERLFVHNGVTTEPIECDDATPHARHLWQPGEGTERFTCPGRGVVEVPGLGGVQVPEPIDVGTFDDPDAVISAREGFHAWWVAMANKAAPTIERKAGEYGSNSLAEMGRMFARAQGRPVIEDAEALEIGCMIYAKGKLERVLDAMLKGRTPSVDTWHDLGVYASMAQYIREHKQWP